MKKKNRQKGKVEEKPAEPEIKVNPFEYRHVRPKFNVLGHQSREKAGHPGAARDRGFKKREETILKEYQGLNKDTEFHDLRTPSRPDFIANDNKSNNFLRKTRFKLNDDEACPMFNDITDFNREHASEGPYQNIDNDVSDEEGKSKVTVIKGGLFETFKKAKLSKRNKDEFNLAKIKSLDNQMDDFMKLIPKTQKERPMIQNKKDRTLQDFDRVMGSFSTDKSRGWAVPQRRLPKEVVARKEQLRIEKLEKEKKSRMAPPTGAYDRSAFSADAIDGLERFDIPKKKKIVNEDEIPESSVSRPFIKMLKAANTKKNDDTNERIDDNSNEEENDDESVSEEESDNEGSDGEFEESEASGDEGHDEEFDESEVEAENTLNEDDFSDTSDISQFGEDEADLYGVQDEVILESQGEGQEAKKDEKMEVERKVKMEETEDVESDIEQSFIEALDVPSCYDDFWQRLHGRSPGQVRAIVRHTIERSQTRGAAHASDSNILFSYLLQTVHEVCIPNADSPLSSRPALLYVDPLVPFLYQLSSANPMDAATTFNQIIDEKYNEYGKSKCRSYPFADTLVFLKLSGVMFPCSDFEHVVSTRVRTFLLQMLGEVNVRCARDAVAALFVAALLVEHLSSCARFAEELIACLHGLLFAALPSDAAATLPSPPFPGHNYTKQLIALHEQNQSCSPSRLTVSLVNDSDLKASNHLKVALLQETLRLLCQVADSWSSMPASSSIFSPFSRLLEAVPSHLYPSATRQVLEETKEAVEAVLTLHRQKAPLVILQKVTKVLEMIEPKIGEVNTLHGFGPTNPDDAMQRAMKLKELQKKVRRERKSVKRELKLDSQFLARQKLKETMYSDKVRKSKVATIMQELQLQQADINRLEKEKKKATFKLQRR